MTLTIQPKLMFKNLVTFLFDPRGRIGRWEFVKNSFYIVMPAWIVFMVGLVLMGGNPSTQSLPLSFYIILILISLISYTAYWMQIIKRLHDLNLSGLVSLVLFVPLVNLFFMFYVLFAKGVEGPTRFEANTNKKTPLKLGFKGKHYTPKRILLTVVAPILALALVVGGFYTMFRYIDSGMGGTTTAFLQKVNDANLKEAHTLFSKNLQAKINYDNFQDIFKPLSKNIKRFKSTQIVRNDNAGKVIGYLITNEPEETVYFRLSLQHFSKENEWKIYEIDFSDEPMPVDD